MSYRSPIDDMPRWQPPDDGKDTPPKQPTLADDAAVRPPAEAFVAVGPDGTDRPSAPTGPDTSAIYEMGDEVPSPPTLDDLEAALDEPKDTPEPAPTTELVPRPPADFSTQVEDTTVRLEEMRVAAHKTPGATPVEHIVDGTQVDLATFVVASTQLALEQRQKEAASQVPELDTTAPKDTTVLVEQIKTDPSMLRDLVLKSAHQQPDPGSTRDILRHADPQLDFEEPTSQEVGRARLESETETKFFDSLLLQREAPPGEKSELDEVWELRDQAQRKVKPDEEPKNPLVSLADKVKGIPDAMNRLAARDARLTQGMRERSEESKLRVARIIYNRHMINGETEKALAVLDQYVDDLNETYIQLQRVTAPPKDQHGQKAREEAYSLPGHEDRLKALMVHKWKVRWAENRQQQADEGLIVDYARVVGMAEQKGTLGNFSAAEDPIAFMLGDRPVNVIPEAVRMKATLAAMKIRYEFTYNRDKHQVVELAAKELSDLYEDPVMQREAAWLARNPSAMLQGEMPRMTPEELQMRIELTATMHKMTLLTLGASVAEEMLDTALHAVTDRLEGEVVWDALTASGGIESRPSEKYIEPSIKQLQTLEDQLLARMKTEEIERGGRAKHQTEVAYKAIRAARAARERDHDGRLDREHKASEEQAAQDYIAQHYPGHALIINGAVEREDGKSGALAAALAAHGAPEITLMGRSPLGTSTVRQLGNTVINRATVLPSGAEPIVAIEGRAPLTVDADAVLTRVERNGVLAMSATLNPTLAAETVLRISPDWYANSDLPTLVAQAPYLTEMERKKVDSERRQWEYQASIGGTPYTDEYRIALVPSTVCRFTATPQGIHVEQGHVMERRGRMPDLTLVVCRNKADGSPSDLYEEIQRIPGAIA